MTINFENFENPDQILNSQIIADLIDRILVLLQNSEDQAIVGSSLACLTNLIVSKFSHSFVTQP